MDSRSERKIKRNKIIILLIATVLILSTLIIILPQGQITRPKTPTGNYIVTTQPSITGLPNNPLKIEYWSNSTATTPIVILSLPLGSYNFSDVTDFQTSLTKEGYVTICSIPKPDSYHYQQAILDRHNDLVTILNWIGNANLGVGDSENIALIGASTGGASILTYDYSELDVTARVSLYPAFNYSNAISDGTPNLILTGTGDTGFVPHAKQYYNQLSAPKAFINIKGANHLDAYQQGQGSTYQQILLKYTLAFLDFATLQSQEALNTFITGATDANLANFDSAGLAIAATPTPVKTVDNEF
jgi:hypothetical protein